MKKQFDSKRKSKKGSTDRPHRRLMQVATSLRLEREKREWKQTFERRKVDAERKKLVGAKH